MPLELKMVGSVGWLRFAISSLVKRHAAKNHELFIQQEIAEPHWLLHPLPAQDYCIEAIPGNNRKLRKCVFSPQVCLTTVWLRKLFSPEKGMVFNHCTRLASSDSFVRHWHPPGHGWVRRRRWRGRDGIPGWSGRGRDPVGLSKSWAVAAVSIPAAAGTDLLHPK